MPFALASGGDCKIFYDRAVENLTLNCRVLDWLAWAPGLDSKEKWISWCRSGKTIEEALQTFSSLNESPIILDPPMTFLPLGLRKKLSGLTKISLWLAHHILVTYNQQGTVSTVFASRHGESEFTVSLLNEISKQLPLSPMSFSRSVHNTASGIFGIAEKNRAASTAVAAGHQTFEMGALQAVASLVRTDKVLYIMADDTIPSEFLPYLNEPWGKYGVAFLLGKGGLNDKFTIQKEVEVPTALSTLRGLIKTTEVI